MKLLAVASSSPAGGDGAPPAGTRDEELALVRRAQAGDMAAFEALYRRHLPRVFGLCWRLARDEAGAEELAQETFARAFTHLAGFRGDAAFATWLHRLAVNLALDERRARQRAPWAGPGATDPPLDQAPAAGRNPDAGHDLERALRTLPARARAVFVLHDIEGHRHDEIAALMGVDAGTSKSQLHRARKLLREALCS